jgi:hypothetical protein
VEIKVDIRNLDGAGDDPTRGCLVCGKALDDVQLHPATTFISTGAESRLGRRDEAKLGSFWLAFLHSERGRCSSRVDQYGGYWITSSTVRINTYK